MRRFIQLSLLIALQFLSGKMMGQSNFIIPEKIKSDVKLIASSAMDSASFGEVHLFNIGIVLSNSGRIKDVYFSDSVEFRIEKTIRKTIRENKTDWKAIFKANKLNGDICLLIPVFYAVELPDKSLVLAADDISKKFLALFTFSNRHQHRTTIIMEPNIYTGNIYH